MTLQEDSGTADVLQVSPVGIWTEASPALKNRSQEPSAPGRIGHPPTIKSQLPRRYLAIIRKTDKVKISDIQMNVMPASPTSHALLTALQLGHQLRSARQQRRLTQAEVAARVGLSQNRLSHLERHAEQLSVQQLLAWCAAVGLELSLGERPGAASTALQTDSSGVPPSPAPEW